MDGKAAIRVDEVDPQEVILHQYLALLGLGHGQVGLVLQHLGAAGLLDDHALHRLRYGRHGADLRSGELRRN